MLDEALIYEILSVVSEIPAGCVATYGQIAALIGRPKNARLVGRVLHGSELYGDFPLSPRRQPCGAARSELGCAIRSARRRGRTVSR